jgi:predicted TIM-barrel fold metal-dependent hydrolase
VTADLFDVNAMIGRLPNEPAGEDVAGLEAALARVGVGAAIVSHVRAWQQDPAEGNHLVVAAVADRPGLRPCWVAVPDTCGELGDADRFVSRAVAAGVVAVRAYPVDHGFSLAGKDFAPVVDAVAEASVPLLVDADQTTWDDVEAVAAAHPRIQLVVCTVGYRTMRRLAGTLSRTPNVSVDLSYLCAHQALEWLVERVGHSRVLFGTGAPRRDPADAVTRLMWSGLGDAEVRGIGSGNLRRMLATGATPAGRMVPQ